MNVDLIKKSLKNQDTRILFLEKTSSTNITAKEKSAEYDVIFAEEQTRGRGRFERKFFSPPGTGIYMSVITRGVISVGGGAATLITPAAAVAVCRAVRGLTCKSPRIKWVNDVLIDNKKICGILCESSENSIIVGIGINFTTEFSEFSEFADFASGKKINAGAVFNKNEIPACRREELAARVINELYDLIGDLCNNNKPSFMDEYRKLSCIIGRDISYTHNNERFFGTAIDIDDDGKLLVKNKAGEITALSSGGITLV